MRKDARTIRRAVGDVVYRHAARRVQAGEVANALCNLMIGAGCVPEAADDLSGAL
jgi:hypothetical protein